MDSCQGIKPSVIVIYGYKRHTMDKLPTLQPMGTIKMELARYGLGDASKEGYGSSMIMSNI